MVHRRRRDDANLHLLEGLLFVGLLLIPLLVLQNQSLPSSDRASQGREVQRTLGNLLAFYDQAPDPEGVHASYLDLMVARALQGDPALFESRVPRPLPKGTAFNVFLDQGQDLHRLRWDGTPPGEAVSASLLWSPDWGPVLAAPQVALIDAQRSALHLDLVPLRGGVGLAEQPGLLAEVVVELPDGTDATLRTFAPLRNGTAAGPGVSLALLDSAGAAVQAVEPAADNATLVVQVQETQGRPIPAGTPVQVLLPPGFRDVALRPERNGGWTDLAVAGDLQHGWNLTARLAAPLSDAAQKLVVNATRPGGSRFQLVEARMDGGRLGALQGLFLDVGNATASAALPPGRGPFARMPGHAPWSAPAPAGVVVAYPDDLARTLTVRRFALTASGGASLTSAVGTAPTGGTWSFARGVLSWDGAETLPNDEVVEFRFDLQASAPADPESAGLDGLGASFPSDYAPRARWQRSAGLFGLDVAGATGTTAGFNATAGPHHVLLEALHRGEALQGRADYETTTNAAVTASASDLARGLQESSFEVATPRVRLGGAATVAWDLDRLVQEVVGAPGDPFRCYLTTAGSWTWTADRAACLAAGGLSWQFVDQPPAVALRVHHPAPAAAGEVGALERQLVGLPSDGTAQVPFNATSLLGTHVLELRVDFDLLGPSGATEVQTVRFLGLLEAQRPRGSAVDRPLYDLVLQAWLPEWG